jgi:hypothetical protein
MLKLNITALLATVLLFASAATAQKLLEKPIDQWSRSDALEILNSSPWAQTYQSTAAAASAAAAEALRQQSDNRMSGRERGRSEQVGAPPPVVVRLHSGLIIRLALTRMNQIGANYDKLDDTAKAQFNESARRLLDCAPCQNYYVVTLTQAPNPSGQFVEEAIFQGMTLEQMKGNVTLRNEKGETRELAQFIAPQKRGDSAVFFFARKDAAGNVLITKDTDFSLVFNPAFLTPNNRFAHLVPRKFDFKTSKITIKDQVIF